MANNTDSGSKKANPTASHGPGDPTPVSEPCGCKAPPSGLDLALPEVARVLRPGDKPWITSMVNSGAGPVPVVATRLTRGDRIGSWKARWNIGRMNFTVPPGLYAVGTPSDKSPVFVSASYKMSFDRLRASLDSRDGWIMVIDTKGINVWCAAGKGTFGTNEIVNRVALVHLDKVVSHRRLTLPQLGAPGVAAHTVREQTGFRVAYGPVRAEDIPGFLAAGNKATPEMRRVRFGLWDRLVVVPVDLVGTARWFGLAAIVMLALSGLGRDGYSMERLKTIGGWSLLALVGLNLAAHVLPQALLPWLPGRSFALKGGWIGLLIGGLTYVAMIDELTAVSSLNALAWIPMAVGISSFVTMNFTGSSTYTSLSRVLKEMKYALPAQIGLTAVGLIMWGVGLFV